MLATFYNLVKRSNSTKQPTEALTELNVVLKHPTSLEAPTLLIAGSAVFSTIMAANMVRFNNTYYKIDAKNIIRDELIEVVCSMDYLATYKADILQGRATVLYSTNKYDITLVDNRMGVRNVRQLSKASFNLDFAYNGCYSLTLATPPATSAIIGNGSTTKTYIMNGINMSSFVRELFEPTIWESIAQYFNSPMDAILSCKTLPIEYVDFDIVPENVKVGNYTFTAVQGKAITNRVISRTGSLTIPYFINMEDHVDFTNLEPYTITTLSLPFIGIVQFDLMQIFPKTALYIVAYLDIVTTDIVYALYDAFPLITPIATYSGTAGSDCPITNVSKDVIGALASLTTAAVAVGVGAASVVGAGAAGAALMTSTAVKAAGAAAASSAMAVNNALKVNTMVNGAISSNLGTYIDTEGSIRLLRNAPTISSENINMLRDRGGLVNAYIDLIDCTGYLQTVDANIRVTGEIEHGRIVSDMLNSGIYIE